MRRVRPLLAILGVLACAFAVPARAATDEGILLNGSRTAYVDVYVYASTTIASADVSMRTKGSYVGFFFSPAPADRDTVGALVMPRVGTDQMKLGASWDVRPGKYRVFLLTDGPAEVFVPISGQGFRAYKPDGRVPSSVGRADFDVPAGTTAVSRDYPLAPRARSLVVAAAMVSSASLTAIDQMSACVTSDGVCTPPLAAATRVPAARASAYGVNLVAPGRYSGVIDVRRMLGDDAGSHVDGAILVLTIGVQT